MFDASTFACLGGVGTKEWVVRFALIQTARRCDTTPSLQLFCGSAA